MIRPFLSMLVLGVALPLAAQAETLSTGAEINCSRVRKYGAGQHERLRRLYRVLC